MGVSECSELVVAATMTGRDRGGGGGKLGLARFVFYFCFQ